MPRPTNAGVADGRRANRGTSPVPCADWQSSMLLGNRVNRTRRRCTGAMRSFRSVAIERAWFPVEDYDLWLRLIEVGEFHAVGVHRGQLHG